MSYKFNSVDPVKTIPGEGWGLVAHTLQDRFDIGPSSKEEIDSTAAGAWSAGSDVQITEIRKPWWNWSHYMLFVKEGANV